MEPNRVVERDPFPYRAPTHVWHSSDDGDIKELIFMLPSSYACLSQQPCGSCHGCEMVQKAYRQYGVQWIEKGQREGWAINTHFGVRCHGGYPTLDIEHLDKLMYVITVRARRTRPLIMKSEDAEAVLTTPPTGRPGVGKIYAAAAKLPPEMIEQQVRNQAAAEAKVEGFRHEIQQQKQDRLDRGLPAYDPEPDIKEAVEGTDNVPDALIVKGDLHEPSE